MKDKNIIHFPELNYLLSEVEEKFGRKLATSTDFEILSLHIDMISGEMISASTLKRLWGYVNLTPKPRIATLDILAKYLGLQGGFKEYCQKLKDSNIFASTFFTSNVVETNSLKTGTHLIIGWAPNRLLELDYLGGSKFRVITSTNSQLMIGDEFESTEFILGYPLILNKVFRNGTNTYPFIAGRQGGLNHIQVVKECEAL